MAGQNIDHASLPAIVELPQWSEGSITDAKYRQKFVDVVNIIADWMKPAGGLAGKHILDFGCGEATSAIGIALRHPDSRVIGIDIMDDVKLCTPLAAEQLLLQELPANLSLFQVAPGDLAGTEHGFDLIYSWSVFEHVNQGLLDPILRQLRATLRPGGKLFIQIAPLYYSMDGSHLMSRVPEPWGHLANQTSTYKAKLRATCASEAEFAEVMSMFETLNRLTATQLHEAVTQAGFTIEREFTTTQDQPIPANLLETYSEIVLRTNQIALLASKA